MPHLYNAARWEYQLPQQMSLYPDRRKPQIDDIPPLHPARLPRGDLVHLPFPAALDAGAVLAVEILYVPAPSAVVHDGMLPVNSPCVIGIFEIDIHLERALIPAKDDGCLPVDVTQTPQALPG